MITQNHGWLRSFCSHKLGGPSIHIHTSWAYFLDYGTNPETMFYIHTKNVHWP